MLGTTHDKANKEDMHAWMSHTHEHVRRLVDEHSKLTYLHLQNHACMPSNQEYNCIYKQIDDNSLVQEWDLVPVSNPL